VIRNALAGFDLCEGRLYIGQQLDVLDDSLVSRYVDSMSHRLAGDFGIVRRDSEGRPRKLKYHSGTDVI
jgi:hypothetical protein